MSLVAYGDSDNGSSDSEGEESIPSSKTTASLSTADIDVQDSSGISKDLSTPVEKRTILSALLPKPKNQEAYKPLPKSDLGKHQNFDRSEEDEIIEVEEEYVPLSEIRKNRQAPTVVKNEEQKSVGSLFSRMPSPWSLGIGISLGKKTETVDEREETREREGNRKGKQPVRIVAPKAIESDSDEEEDSNNVKPAAKRMKKSKEGSGLSSLLPKPRHSITLTKNNPNKPSAKLANRLLIPHTLTKKPVPTQKNTNTKKNDDDGSGDEDDDNEPASFFSFSESKIETSNQPLLTVKDFGQEDMASTSTVNSEEKGPTFAPISYGKSETITSVPEVQSMTHTTEMDTTHAAISYEGGASGYSYSGASGDSQYNDGSEATSTTYYQQTQDADQQYGYGYDQNTSNTAYEDSIQPMYNQTYTNTHADPPPFAQEEDIDMEKLIKLQGRKNRHEQINIIDINAADQTSDTKLRMTKMSTEQLEHRSSKKKGHMPSSQQRRKHQITYLAFQAKEREFELQQQWSSNRQSKRQTQAKYGF